VIKPSCLLSSERDGKSKSTKAVCWSQYLTVSAHLDSCRTITFRAAASMHDLALYHFAWISCKNPGHSQYRTEIEPRTCLRGD
jgi:hypothetical protein